LNDAAPARAHHQGGWLGLPWWSWAAPVVAGLAAAAKLGHVHLPPELVAPILIGAVLAGVHHAEVIAHRIGEPFGTLVLAIAVTTIEVGLIVSLMLEGGPEAAALARDTVFAAVMILLNGIVGLCLLIGGGRYGVQRYNLDGATAALTVMAPLLVLTLLLPNVTKAEPGPYYSSDQLVVVGIVSVVLYLSYVFVQTVRHRDYFLAESPEAAHHARPSVNTMLASVGLMLVALFGVVMMGKALAPTIEDLVAAIGAPRELVGVIIATIVLLPEGLAAVRAARADRLQDSLNLALGSALASIGLTIPAVAVVSLVLGVPLVLGLDDEYGMLLVLSLFLLVVSLRTGRTTVLNGIVHLTVFAVYLLLVIVP
jgi:Ca2+:H+ antiporter